MKIGVLVSILKFQNYICYRIEIPETRAWIDLMTNSHIGKMTILTWNSRQCSYSSTKLK